LDGEGDVGERTDGNESDFMRRGVHQFDDEVGAPAGVDFAFAGREVDIGEAVPAVPELGGDQLLKERMLSAGGDGDVTAIGQGDHAQGVIETLLGSDVSGDDGDRADVEFGELRASMMAMASSVPGSVSMMILRGAAIEHGRKSPSNSRRPKMDRHKECTKSRGNDKGKLGRQEPEARAVVRHWK